MEHILKHNLTDRTFISNVLLVLGGYGVIHVLAQDFGFRTGINQRNLVQTEPLKFILHFAGAFTLLRNYTLSFFAASLYYFLKYIYSRSITADRCTPDDEIYTGTKPTIPPPETGLPNKSTTGCPSKKKQKPTQEELWNPSEPTL